MTLLLLMALQPNLGPGRFFQFLNLKTQLAGLLQHGVDLMHGRYLHRTTQTQNKCRQTSMPLVGLEPMIPVSEQARTFYAFDREATVIGFYMTKVYKFRI
jgi:hypothetical protein